MAIIRSAIGFAALACSGMLSGCGSSAGTTTAAPTPVPVPTPPPTEVPTPSPVPPPPLSMGSAQKDEFLAEHNKYRCMHGAGNLVWNDAMALSAASWGQSCCQGGLKHSNSYQETPSSGENLAAGDGSIAAAIRGWYDEVKDCTKFPGCIPGKGTTGHFTAMIWSSSTQLGCAVNPNGWRGDPVYVCRYSTNSESNAPNMGGLYQSNVFAKSKQESQCSGSSLEAWSLDTNPSCDFKITFPKTTAPTLPGEETVSETVSVGGITVPAGGALSCSIPDIAPECCKPVQDAAKAMSMTGSFDEKIKAMMKAKKEMTPKLEKTCGTQNPDLKKYCKAEAPATVLTAAMVTSNMLMVPAAVVGGAIGGAVVLLLKKVTQHSRNAPLLTA